MDLKLENRRALVTGSSLGIGFSIARELAREGATVILSSRSSDHIENALSDIRKEIPHAKLEAMVLDVSNESTTRAALSPLNQRPIDILVNNSGGPPAGDPSTLGLKDWDIGYQSLIRSVLTLTELLLPSMIERKWGRILNITSTAAGEYIPRLPVSATFRAGLSAWAKNLAKDISHKGVLVNNLLPGPTNTDRLKELEKKSPQFFQSMEAEMAIGRLIEPNEIGRVAAFLCSEANTVITGTDILVDGGYTRAW